MRTVYLTYLSVYLYTSWAIAQEVFLRKKTKFLKQEGGNNNG